MFISLPYPVIAGLSFLLLAGCATTTVETKTTPEQPGTSVPQVQTAQEVVSPDNYVLGQGDRISIQVFDEPDLTLESTVSANGVINYSYLGDLRVSGKTPFELEQEIAIALKNGFLVNPSVNVSVVQFRPFFIGGEVRAPGSYPYQPGLTLDKAIALAGGLTERASQRRMFVVKSGAPATDQTQTSLGDPVGPGDTITIKEGFF